jgi:hypothetical protein
MRVTIYKGERQLSDLARRLFDLKGSKAKELTKKTETAILLANPHLRDLNHVPEGTLIIVPDVPGANRSDEASGLDFGAGQLGEELRRVHGAAQQAMKAGIADLTEEAKTSLELQKSPELKRLAEKDRTIPEQLAKVGAEAKKGLEEAKALTTMREQAFTQMGKDLDEFLKQFAGKQG